MITSLYKTIVQFYCTVRLEFTVLIKHAIAQRQPSADRIFRLIDPAYQGCYTKSELNRFLKIAGFNVEKDSNVRFGFIW